jgi:hypothetical protein
LGRTRTGLAAATRDETRMTRHPRRAPNYDRKLTRRITLEDGTNITVVIFVCGEIFVRRPDVPAARATMR